MAPQMIRRFIMGDGLSRLIVPVFRSRKTILEKLSRAEILAVIAQFPADRGMFRLEPNF
jgi:hypothetical protein